MRGITLSYGAVGVACAGVVLLSAGPRVVLGNAAEGRTVLYVDDDAAGPVHDGLSWLTAYADLQDALDHARVSAGFVTDIRVAHGTYHPDRGIIHTLGDRTETFQLVDGVSLEGGYAGVGEPDPNAHDINAYETILSGDLNGDDGPLHVDDFSACHSGWGVPLDPGCAPFDLDQDGDVDLYDLGPFLATNNQTENSKHVVTGTNTSGTAVLEGFTVTAGNTDESGAGLYNSGASPTIAHCIFHGNIAFRFGAGTYNGDESNPTITDCAFRGNVAFEGGAGMYNADDSSPAIANSMFNDNVGRAVINTRGSNPIFVDCTFTKNCGGGMYNEHFSSPTLRNCNFEGNFFAYRGGGMYNVYYSSPTLTNCTFAGNSADYSGGGMHNRRRYTEPILTDCVFVDNSAGTYGGGMHNDGASPTLIRCEFHGNRTTGQYGSGGGMGNEHGHPTAIDCTFSENSALGGGGVFTSRDSTLALTNCTFCGNSADEGGAISTFSFAAPMLTNCVLTGNSANIGGGIYIGEDSNPTVSNCTFNGNTAPYGMAIALDSYGQWHPSVLEIAGSILWDGPEQIWNNDNSTITIAYSDVSGGWPGVGNIDLDPWFVDPVGPDGVSGTADDDLRLAPGSPCIDAGDNEAVPEDVTTDLDGRPRLVDDPDTSDTGAGYPPIVDMGAYEYQPVVPAYLDIRPGRCPNRLNRRANGLIRVAVVGTEWFDVSAIDLDSLALARADGVGGMLGPSTKPRGLAPRIQDVATPFDGELCDCHRLRHDGIDDLVMRFRIRRIVDILGLSGLPTGTEVALTVTGSLLDGTRFEAADCVLLTGPGASPHRNEGGRR